MLRHPGPSDLYVALLAEGFELPEECADIELVMPVDGVMQLRYSINIRGERLSQLGRALARIGNNNIPDWRLIQDLLKMAKADGKTWQKPTGV